MRIFVDCDDTLVLWADESRKISQDKEIWMREKYEMNWPLISSITNIQLHHPDSFQLVVWSGGGVEYASRWADKAGLKNFIVLPKDMRIPEGDDICIDDMYGELAPRDERVKVISPDFASWEWDCPICFK